jgi:hypothetical protein
MSGKSKKEKEVPIMPEKNEDSIWDSFWKLEKPEAEARPQAEEQKTEENTFRWF